MNTAENVIQLTDTMRAFLDKLDADLHTSLKPSITSFPSEPEHWANVQKVQDSLCQQYNPMLTNFLDASSASLSDRKGEYNAQTERSST